MKSGGEMDIFVSMTVNLIHPYGIWDNLQLKQLK